MKTEIIKHLQGVLKVDQDGVLGPITRNAFATALINIAKKEVGIFETSKNHGDGIAKYWTACEYSKGYVYREPYCAAFMSWIFKQSGLFNEENRPKTASAFSFEQWGKNIGMIVIKNPETIKKSDLVIFNFSHIGIATSDSDSKGNFKTIEANTNPQGERDGNGVYQKSRNLGVVRSVVRL